MKKINILTSIFLLLFAGLFAQQTTPQGMQYQAVARDLQGKILPNQEVILKINLVNNGKSPGIFYSEVHEVTTNQLGLFALVIGAGKVDKGKFSEIPWSTQDIWMQVAIKDKGKTEFATISNSKLLAVPYAFHAATASQLAGSFTSAYKNGTAQTDAETPGVPSQNWSLFGNSKSDATKDKLGTTDYEDLVLVTNNIERLRILANGDINIKRTLNIGANLNADSSVFLNRLGGSTTNYGPFTVARESPTLLTGSLTVAANQPTFLGGTLTVDKATDLNASLNVDGITNLNSALNVNNGSATKLTGSLQVDGVTNLNSALNVNNGSPTLLTGTLQVNKDATFKEHVVLDNPAYNSTSISTGALVVNGGVGIGKNLNVGGASTFGGSASFGGAVTITDLTESVSTTTGALIIGGGVGIGKRLNVGGGGIFEKTLGVTGATTLSSTLDVTGATTLGSILDVTGATTLSSTLGVTGATTLSNTLGVAGATNLNSTLGVTGAASLSNTLSVSGITSITNATPSTSTATGALIVSGGLGIGQNLNVGGSFTTSGPMTINNTLAANGQVTITANPGGGESVYTAYPLQVQGSTQGIAVKVSGSRTSANNFVSFWDDNGMQGRIEGQTLDELHSDDDYKSELASRVYDVTSSTIDLLFATNDLAAATTDQIASAASANACAGLGIVACPPIASLIAGSAVNLALAIAQEIVVIADVAFASVNLAQFVDRKEAAVGVSYQSSAGDYAEYLMREQTGERITPGDIVGVRGGKISKNTQGAERVMVISHKPIVLGNVPQGGNEHHFEKVAFMGQVPVKVIGKVNLGDYIIANGANNGVGIALAPDKIEAKDIKNIVGIAWSTAAQGFQFSMVNVAIGLNVNDNQKLIDEQKKEIKDLKNEISGMNNQLTKLLPGFKASNMVTTDPPVYTKPIVTGMPQQLPTDISAKIEAGNPNIKYVEMTKQDLIHAFELAEKTSRANGVDMNTNVFWKRFKADPSFREFTLNKAMTNYAEALKRQKELDGKLK
ncbi:MAG: hypothetical protein WKF97_13100 [Chitinophagaceae bacterium]